MKTEFARDFADTNVWFYAFSAQDVDLKGKAQALITQRKQNLCVSTQVINELCFNLKRKAGFDDTQVTSLTRSFFANYPVVLLDEEILLSACKLRMKYPFSFGTDF